MMTEQQISCACEYVHGDNPRCPVHGPPQCEMCGGHADQPWMRIQRGFKIVAHFTDDEVGNWHDIATEDYAHYRCPSSFHSAITDASDVTVYESQEAMRSGPRMYTSEQQEVIEHTVQKRTPLQEPPLEIEKEADQLHQADPKTRTIYVCPICLCPDLIKHRGSGDPNGAQFSCEDNPLGHFFAEPLIASIVRPSTDKDPGELSALDHERQLVDALVEAVERMDPDNLALRKLVMAHRALSPESTG